jgi:hypothetical protein
MSFPFAVGLVVLALLVGAAIGMVLGSLYFAITQVDDGSDGPCDP